MCDRKDVVQVCGCQSPAWESGLLLFYRRYRLDTEWLRVDFYHEKYGIWTHQFKGKRVCLKDVLRGKKNAVGAVAIKLVHVEREDVSLRFGDGVVSLDWIHASKAIGVILLNSYHPFDLRGNEPNQLPPVDGDHASTRVWRGAAFAALTSMFCPARKRLSNWGLLQPFVFNTFSIHHRARSNIRLISAILETAVERGVRYSRVKTQEYQFKARQREFSIYQNVKKRVDFVCVVQARWSVRRGSAAAEARINRTARMCVRVRARVSEWVCDREPPGGENSVTRTLRIWQLTWGTGDRV